MMKKYAALCGIAVLMFALPVVVLAGEHGGKEHAGSAETHEGSHGHAMSDKDVLMEAATALQAIRPDLAEKLKAMAGDGAKEHGGKEHGGM